MRIGVRLQGTLRDSSGGCLGGEMWLGCAKARGAELFLLTAPGSEARAEGREWLIRQGLDGMFSDDPAPDLDLVVDGRALGAPRRREHPASDRCIFDWHVAGPKLLELMGGAT